MDNLNTLSKTPTKMRTNHSFQLPDTPTSLASSYNDVIIPKKRKTLNLGASDNANESINSLQTNSMVDFTKKIKYNPLHDSIESFISDRISSNHHHNSSILGDFEDIKAMIDQKNNEQHHENESDLIQKWLQDRKRWDTIQQTYEQKVVEIENKLQNKAIYFNKKLDSMLKQELEYQDEIKNLKQQIEGFKSSKNEQFIKLDQDYQELSENNRELNTKFQDLQQTLHEKENIIQRKQEIIEKIEIDHKNIKENNNDLLKKIDAINMNTKGLNEEIINITKELNEYKQENERLKHLEVTSQNMVERLLKRLEQQIHSAENIQKQLNLKEKQHDKEIMRLEQINCKLQKHLTIFNNKNDDKSKSNPSSPCSSSSDSSLFTVSTVMTTEKQQIKHHQQKNKYSIYSKEIESLKKENESLKETINTFREMVNIDEDDQNHQDRKKQNDEEWINRIKEIAKQTVLIEKLKNDIMERDGEINQYKHSINQYETVTNDQKETINSLQITINQQRNNISMLEKTNSDISMELIEERALRQRLEKEIENIQFENKQLRNKLIAFKNFASQTTIENKLNDEQQQQQQHESTDDEIFGHNTDNNTMINSIHKDQLLLDSLRHLLHKYSNNLSTDINKNNNNTENMISPQEQRRSHSANHRTTSTKRNKKHYKFNTPKNTMVNRGNFIHQTFDRLDIKDNNNKKSRHRISSMTPVSYLHDANNNNTARNISMKRKRNSNYRKRSISMHQAQPVSVCRNNRNKSKITSNSRKINKSKNGRIANSTKPKSKTGINKIRRKKTGHSASKQHALKACIHNKHWV